MGSSLLQFFHDPADGAPWETGETPTWIYNLGDHPTDTPPFPGSPLGRVRDRPGEDEPAADTLEPSGELAAPLLEGVLCGVATRLDAVNVPNAGHVPGLPDGAVVEVPARADASGLHPVAMARLPEGILGLLRTQATINRLLVEAFAEGSRRKLLQAMLLDPTTALLPRGGAHDQRNVPPSGGRPPRHGVVTRVKEARRPPGGADVGRLVGGGSSHQL